MVPAVAAVVADEEAGTPLCPNSIDENGTIEEAVLPLLAFAFGLETRPELEPGTAADGNVGIIEIGIIDKPPNETGFIDTFELFST